MAATPGEDGDFIIPVDEPTHFCMGIKGISDEFLGGLDVIEMQTTSAALLLEVHMHGAVRSYATFRNAGDGVLEFGTLSYGFLKNSDLRPVGGFFGVGSLVRTTRSPTKNDHTLADVTLVDGVSLGSQSVRTGPTRAPIAPALAHRCAAARSAC